MTACIFADEIVHDVFPKPARAVEQAKGYAQHARNAARVLYCLWRATAVIGSRPRLAPQV
jgi:hypothetical protein